MAEFRGIRFDREDVIKAFEHIEKYGAPNGFDLKGKRYDVRYNGLEYCITALFKVVAGDRIRRRITGLEELRDEFRLLQFEIVDKRSKNEVIDSSTPKKSFIVKKNNKTKDELLDKDFYSLKAEELLKEFIEYDEIYDNNIGVYAIYLKDNSLIEAFSCKDYIKERFSELNRIPNNIYNNLFYIGVTGKGKKSCFKNRLINGHAAGKHATSFNLNILKGFGYKVNNHKAFTESKTIFLQNKISWEKWFEKYFTYKILPLDKKSAAEFVEALLIYAYQPPFNKEGCDDSPF